ncbi:alpha tubulin suppressor [Coemansia sp. RSA 988]|nr:alpha tubulin suppressor [Coemansia sp. RSA 988]
MVIILALGSNSGGQLATSDLEDVHTLAPCKFAAKDRVNISNSTEKWHVCGGGNHAFAWSSDGTHLLACGSNKDGERGCGYASSTPVLEWVPIIFPGRRVVQVACGWNHTLLLNEQGEVYAAGSNGFGQCSTASIGGAWSRVLPSSIDTAEPVVFTSIACGLRHSLALSNNGLVYGWGACRAGQLGMLDDGKNAKVQSIMLISDKLPPISMITCGRSHSILLSCDRQTVFVSGQDKYAQCGPSNVQPTAGAWRSFRFHRPALKICSGWEFGAALLEPPHGDKTSSGAIVAWGRSDHGQLAQATQAPFYRELVDVPLADVCDLACGSNHVVAMTVNGDAFMWGWNEHGNAGDPSLKDVFQPARVSSGRSVSGARHIVNTGIGCGYGNSYVIQSQRSSAD